MITLNGTDTVSAVAGTGSAITYTFLGGTNRGGGEAFKVLAQGQLPSSVGTIWPATGGQSQVGILFVNTTALSVTGIKLFVNGTAVTNQIIGTVTIPANGTAEFDGLTLRVWDSSGAVVTTSTVTLTGDVTGSGTGSLATTLASIISAGGPTGSASVVPVVTYDAKGRLTAVTTATITPAAIGAQPLDGTLTALAAADWAANAVPIGTGADTLAQTTFAANTFPARASTGNLVAKVVTDFGLSLVDDANQAAAQTTLGVPPATRAINTTAPITGGGDLSADRTLALTTSPVGQTPVGVTRTIGTSGAALSGGGDLSADRTITLNESPNSASVVGTGRSIATTAPITGGGTLAADLTLALTTSPVGQTPVGVTRSIATTAPITGGGTLAADLTLALTTSPTGQTPVGVTRTITATTPIQIAGTTSADLSADRTISIIPASATLAGSMSAAGFRKERDQYADVVNDLGADATGATDASGLITTWIGTLTASGGGMLFIPANARIRVDGPVVVNKDNVRVIGACRRSSIIGTGSATLTQFDVTADACTFENLRFEAGTTAQNLALRSAGFCVDIDATSNGSGVYKCDFIGQWSSVNIEGQLGFVDDANIREYGAQAGSGACIRVNAPAAGGDTYIRRVLTDNGSNIAGWAGVRVLSCASLIMESCNLIHATNALALEPPAAGTVPSVEVTNTFFDTCTNGLNINPNATGFVYRSKFTNCWFGSNTGAGVLMNNPGGAAQSFDGITFNNCDFYGNGTGISTPTGGGKWAVLGSRIAGNTVAGISLVASAAHYPRIIGNTIAPTGAFGVNLVGITVAAGAYKGLTIQTNDVVNNTTNFTLGAVTVGAGEAGFYRITDNAGINPRGAVTTPAVAGTGVAVTNITGFRVLIGYKTTGTVNTAFNINGVAFAAPNLQTVTTLSYITLEPGGTITWTGGTAPTWVWVGQ